MNISLMNNIMYSDSYDQCPAAWFLLYPLIGGVIFLPIIINSNDMVIIIWSCILSSFHILNLVALFCFKCCYTTPSRYRSFALSIFYMSASALNMFMGVVGFVIIYHGIDPTFLPGPWGVAIISILQFIFLQTFLAGSLECYRLKNLSEYTSIQTDL